MKIRTILLGSAVLLTAASSAVPAFAVAPKEAVVCDLKEPLMQLAALKTDGSQDARELELRKEILKASMECNAREASAFEKTVKDMSGSDRSADLLKKRYADQLADTATFAREAAEKAGKLASVSSSKDLARELRDWRDKTYNPLAWQSSQLVVLNKNLSLADAALDRSEQIEVSIDALAETDETEALAKQNREAADRIEDAEESLTDALSLLRTGGIAEREAIATRQKEGMDALSRAYELLIDSNDRIAALKAATPAK